MTTFTKAALLSFISTHHCVPSKTADVMAAYAARESGYDTTKVGHNPNGTEDVGIAQINSSNYDWLTEALGRPVNRQTMLDDPCLNLAAGLRVLLVKYNGNPKDPIKIRYTNGLLAELSDTGPSASATATEVPVEANPVDSCSAPPWDTWGQQACRDNENGNQPTDDKKGDPK